MSLLGRVVESVGGLGCRCRPCFALTALIIAGGVAAWGTWQFRRPQPLGGPIRNVLLISIDTCRADHLSCYGYPARTTPNIDSLCARAFASSRRLPPFP